MGKLTIKRGNRKFGPLDNEPADLTPAQKQKLLVLWLFLTVDPHNIPSDQVIANWNRLAPDLADLPDSQSAFQEWIQKSVPQELQDIGDLRDTLVNTNTPPWSGPGSCSYTIDDLIALLHKVAS
jgi:hypothetical protein